MKQTKGYKKNNTEYTKQQIHLQNNHRMYNVS